MCGDGSDTACTDPDTCDGDGLCLANNEACSQVTDSALCTFDVSPKPGYCKNTGEPCTGDSCGPGDECIGERQFRLLFTPNVQDWPSYKLNASNPGQTFYNAIADKPGCYEGELETFTIKVPFPYVTVGGTPVHIYDGSLVGGDTVGSETCFVPPDEAVAEYSTQVTLADWQSGGGNGLECDQVLYPYPDAVGPAFCTFTVTAEYPASCQLYLNVHLDFGLKGPKTDFFMSSGGAVSAESDGISDRYDKGASSIWGGADAWADGTEIVAVKDCQDLTFSHMTLKEDNYDSNTVQNLNEFKRPAGVFGLLTNGSDVIPGATVRLVHPTDGEITSAVTDQDGYYLLEYKHKGRPTDYSVEASVDGGNHGTARLKGNGFAEASYDAGTDTWSYE